MIEDEVSGALRTTVTEPVRLKQNTKPIQKRVNLSDDEMDEALFFGGKKPKDENDLNIKKLQNENVQKLNKEQSTFLLSQSESGMGYQLVDFLMKNGDVIKDVKILNGDIIKSYKNINSENIKKIIIKK